MKRILAFDPGTANCGYGCIEYEGEKLRLGDYFGTLKTKIEDGSVRERIDLLGERMQNLINLVKPDYLVIEDFTEQGKIVGTTYKEMAWLTEHMRMVGRKLDYEVTIYENGEWKKIALGAMRANKDQVKHYVKHQLPETETLLKKQATHVWDSVGIALAKRKELKLQGVN